MIQRKQTLYILVMAILNCSLMFIPIAEVLQNNQSSPVFLVPFADAGIQSTMGHTGAIVLNFAALLLSFATIFMYKKRNTQIRLLYLLMGIWVCLGAMIAWCPFVVMGPSVQSVNIHYLCTIVALTALIFAWLAIKAIKADLNLLRSADRIR
ncbi:MAG TPA: DUF4293 domain-containing protein [Bacteroidia bacterium]|nr:DUF4293 domain-containing protein [Bacteroidia bacterium]